MPVWREHAGQAAVSLLRCVLTMTNSPVRIKCDSCPLASVAVCREYAGQYAVSLHRCVFTLKDGVVPKLLEFDSGQRACFGEQGLRESSSTGAHQLEFGCPVWGILGGQQWLACSAFLRHRSRRREMSHGIPSLANSVPQSHEGCGPPVAAMLAGHSGAKRV